MIRSRTHLLTCGLAALMMLAYCVINLSSLFTRPSGMDYAPYIEAGARRDLTSRPNKILQPGPRADGSPPKLSALHITFKGNPVDHLFPGIKAKKYFIDLTGTGFLPDTTVFINNTRADTTFSSSTRICARLPGRFVPDPGVMFVQAQNSDGQWSPIISVQILSQ